jgi:predicted small metal-binding protein
MKPNNETELFTRIGKKKAKNINLSRELHGVLDELVEHGRESREIEEAVWAHFVRRHGEQEIQQLVEPVQSDHDDDETRKPRAYTLDA